MLYPHRRNTRQMLYPHRRNTHQMLYPHRRIWGQLKCFPISSQLWPKSLSYHLLLGYLTAKSMLAVICTPYGSLCLENGGFEVFTQLREGSRCEVKGWHPDRICSVWFGVPVAALTFSLTANENGIPFQTWLSFDPVFSSQHVKLFTVLHFIFVYYRLYCIVTA